MEKANSVLTHSLPFSPSLLLLTQRDNRIQLGWSCEEQLFRQEMENADDVRLSVRLFSRCLQDKQRFCPDVAPGNAQVRGVGAM